MVPELQSNMKAPDKFWMRKKRNHNHHPHTLAMSTCRIGVKSSKLEVNLHNEEMEGNEMTAHYL